MGSETMDVLSAGTVFEDGSAYPCSGSSCNVYKDSDCINCLVNTDNRTIWEYDVTESTYTIKLVDITSVEVHMNHDLKSLTGISKKSRLHSYNFACTLLDAGASTYAMGDTASDIYDKRDELLWDIKYEE